MRVRITVTDQQGHTFEGEANLVPATPQGGSASRARVKPVPVTGAKVTFELPRRAFLKKHAQGGGPRKFTVLLAHMAQGKTDVEITGEAIEREWARNKGVLGGDFQSMYATRSREEGWTDSQKRGMFVLRADWREALVK